MECVFFSQEKDLLPVVIFVYSKKQCETSGFGMQHLDLSTSDEKAKIRSFFEGICLLCFGFFLFVFCFKLVCLNRCNCKIEQQRSKTSSDSENPRFAFSRNRFASFFSFDPTWICMRFFRVLFVCLI